MLFAAKLAFYREGIVFQPGQQLLAIGADHFGLRVVNMGVDKTRHDQFVRIVSDLKPRRQQRFALLPAAEPGNRAFMEQH
ncbi:hypothetical protein D3C71_1655070 [compost metagenome]